MDFLQKHLLWGLLAVSIPIIIHLLNRRRHRTVQWAAMDFLLKATRESRGKKKLKYILILTCRALAIAGIIFALARPLIGGFLGLGTNVDTVVLILDRSASMESKTKDGGPSKRELVLQQTAKAMVELEGTNLILVDSATNEISEIPSPEILPSLSSTGPSHTSSNLPNLLALTFDHLRALNPGRTEIWLSSDLQGENWRTDDSRWSTFSSSLESLPSPTSLRVLAFPERPRENVSLRLLGQRRAGNDLLVDLEISREASFDQLSLPIASNLDGATTTETVTITGDSYRFVQSFPLSSTEAKGWGRISLPPDSNINDNTVFFTYGEALTLETVIAYDLSLIHI